MTSECSVKKPPLIQLTALKGSLCIIIYAFRHYSWLMTGGYAFDGRLVKFLYIYGYYGVEAFCLILGFLINYNGKKKAWENRYLKEHNVFSFIKEKQARQYPSLLIALAASVLMKLVYCAKHNSWFYAQNMSLTAWIASALNIGSRWFWGWLSAS